MPVPDMWVAERFADQRLGKNFAEFGYHVFGSDDEKVIRTLLEEDTAGIYHPYDTNIVFWPRASIEVNCIGAEGKLWEAVIIYAPPGADTPLPSGETRLLNFTTIGGTQHITNSIRTVAREAYQSPAWLNANAPDYHGAINVTDNDVGGAVEGVDIPTAAFLFQLGRRVHINYLSPEYQNTLQRLTPTVNEKLWPSSTIKGLGKFAPGSCLFLGATGRPDSEGFWEMVYDFSAAPNRTGIIIGDDDDEPVDPDHIPAVDKLGFDYLWVRYKSILREGQPHPEVMPAGVYVEEVFRRSKFSELGIG